MKKRILINAVSIKEGGGVVVLTQLLKRMSELDKEIYWCVVVDETLSSKIDIDGNIELISFPWVKNTPFHLLYWYQFYLPKLLRRKKIDLLFSQTNFLTLRKPYCPSLLLEHHAGYFSDEFNALFSRFLKRRPALLAWKLRCLWAAVSIKRATHVTVQTKALADAIIKKTTVCNDKISVVPHGSGLVAITEKTRSFPEKEVWRIGYITKFGVQKNFDVLFRAIKSLKNQGKVVKLVLTLDAEHKPYQQVKSLIARYQITDCIENHGEINKKQIQALYQSLDLFVFPSLCESFGFTLVEAMSQGLPVIAADTLSNREILGDDGELFSSEDDKVLADKISHLMTAQEDYENRSCYSVKRSRHYSWDEAAKKLLAITRVL